MTTRSRLWLGVIACGACGGDIRLGGSAPDAAIDSAIDSAIASPFTPGTYSASFLDPALIECGGSLAGHDSDFSAVTRPGSSIIDGSVHLSVAVDQLIVTGTPIDSGFQQTGVMLVPDPNAGLPGLWDVSVTGAFGSGPDATLVSAVGLAVDSTTANAPTGIEGTIARWFATSDASGQCSVTFGALFVRN